jgi:prepilin-type processing-associated H-X9-DG protein
MHVGYIRRSRSHQEISPQRQREEISKWASENGVEITTWYEELPVTGSAPITERPALSLALHNLQKNDTLVVTDITRLSRSQMVFSMVLGTLHQKKAHIAFADGHVFQEDDMMSRLITNLLSWAAEWEKSQISIRTKQSLAVIGRTKALGRPDRCKFGWCNVDGVLQPNQNEQALGVRILEMRSDGMSLRKISSILKDEGVLNRNGNHFPYQNIGHIARTFRAA